MSTKRDDLKAKLLAEAEAAIDKMLSDARLSEHMLWLSSLLPHEQCEQVAPSSVISSVCVYRDLVQ